MRLSTCTLMGTLLLAAPPALAADPIGYIAPDGVNTVAVTPSTPLPTVCQSGCASPVPPANINPNQISVGATATLIAAARSGRQTITVEQLGATAVYLGGSAVTTTTGAWLPGVAGSSITLNFSGALYGITPSGAQAVAEYELY